MAYKVASLSPTFGYYAMDPVDFLKQKGCSVEFFTKDQKENLVHHLRDIDAIIVGFEKITKEVIAAAPKLKVITKHGAGIDNIDVLAASAKGIPVITAVGANSDAVADLTFGLFLSLARLICSADRSVKEGKWPRVVGVQVSGKVLGIIGLGQIGKKVAVRASGFNMKILSYDVVKDEAFAKEWGIRYCPLDDLLADADFVSIHIPLHSTTRRLIGERELKLMKKDAFLVSISRGDIVDEEALYEALKEERIKGAALDVFSLEPPGNSPLLSLDNVIATPHMGGYTFEALRETGMVCVRGIVDVLEGRHPQFAVNPEVLK